MTYASNRHLLIGLARLVGVFFLIERVPAFAYSIAVEVYNASRYQADTWNSNARVGLIGSVIESTILTQLVFMLPIILAACLLIWKAPWLVDRIAPSPEGREPAAPADSA